MSAHKRIGILGGSFDPVHNGHVLMADRAHHLLGLDIVLFIPTNISPFKVGKTNTDAAHRKNMLDLALAEYGDKFQVSTIDIDRGGISYTIDTIEQLRQIYRNAELFYIMGADSLVTLFKWHRANELVAQVKFVTFARQDFPLMNGDIFGFNEEQTKLLKQNIFYDFCCNISSTQIRKRIATQQSVDGMISGNVIKYVREHNLYTTV